MSINKNFVVKHGLEVDTDLILADANNNKVGIATGIINYTLDVGGTIGAKNSVISGVSTVNDIIINSRIGVGNSFGDVGQYLVSTGIGLTWSSAPTVRSTDSRTAGVGETTFNTTYTVGLLDVYINGVKLSSDEFIANDSATVVLDDACFGGETIEFISYSPLTIGFGGTSIQGITILEEGTPVGGALQVTSINFVGAAVTAVGSGLGVTVYITDTDTTNPNYWASTNAGIHTLSNVGIGTTNPRFALEVGAVGASGTSLLVNGDTRIIGILTVGSSSITLDGSNNIINVGSGITINGNTGRIDVVDFYATGIQVGVITATTIVYGDGVTLTQDWIKTDVGIHTLSNVGIGTTNPTSALTVKGNTSLETLNVSGVTTSQEGFTSGIGVTDPVQITVSNNVLTFNVVGVGSTSLTLY